jgi:L,D-peptidoglycan transpeptidase YkuD (ErfK/YbiS/YcfS/YnhG family)
LYKRADTERLKQTNTAIGQPENVAVKSFIGKLGQSANRKEGRKPDDNRNLTL